MRRTLATFISVLVFGTTFTQPILRSSIEDSVLGWKKIYYFKGTTKGQTLAGRNYSAAQLSICDSFANWLQATYVPKGALGDLKRWASPEITSYNVHLASLPIGYGAFATAYTDLKYDAAKKIQLVSLTGVPVHIDANAPFGTPVRILCTANEYYFTLPSFAEQGYSDETQRPYQLATHPNTRRYIPYFQRNSLWGNEKTIMICKDNKPPFIEVKKGEYLQITEATILKEYEREKKSIHDKEKGNDRNIKYFMGYLDDKHAKRLAVLKLNKERYKDRLGEPARIFSIEPGIMLENFPDIFEGNGGSSLRLQVYRLDRAVVQKANTGMPQWITVTWHGDLNDPVGKHQHETMINGFNFEYLYNFFYDPEKVKGVGYKPLRSPLYAENVVKVQASRTSQTVALDKSVFFFEDFSSTAAGKKPVSWKATLARDGSTAVVETPDGLSGNWVVLREHGLADQFKTPLPANFTLTYDLVASEGYTWGSNGLTVQLSDEKVQGSPESSLKLKIRPGADGNNGEAMVEAKFASPPGYMNAAKWLVATGFSNNEKYNRIKVTIRKNDEQLSIWLDGIKAADYEKAIPSALRFNRMTIVANSRAPEKDKMYISNIRITKE